MMEGVLAHSLEVMTLTSEVKELTVEGRTYKYFDLVKIGGREYQKLPFCLRILFEACIRKAASTSDPSLASVWSWSASEILNRVRFFKFQNMNMKN
jgi:aconitase A